MMDPQASKAKQQGLLGAFTSHPASVGESYLEHFAFAMRFSFRLSVASTAALIHAFIPALCETTASRQIRIMHENLSNRDSTK